MLGGLLGGGGGGGGGLGGILGGLLGGGGGGLGGILNARNCSAPQLRLPRPRGRANRPAHALMLPLRLMNRSSGSATGLYAMAYRITRDHSDRVRLSTFLGSAVHKMTAANGSSVVGRSNLCSCRAQRARLMARFAHSRVAPKCLTPTIRWPARMPDRPWRF
jgi:hypothetical protein